MLTHTSMLTPVLSSSQYATDTDIQLNKYKQTYTYSYIHQSGAGQETTVFTVQVRLLPL